MENLFYFLFVFLVLFLISFARSEIEVNLQLQINFKCSTNDDPCDAKNAFCNSAGQCQCLFGYSPNGHNCERFRCGHPGEQTCSQLYNDQNATCFDDHRCNCIPPFELNAHTQKCEIRDPKTRRIGSTCIVDHQCGRDAQCTTMGECRCPPGSLPETEFTCSQPQCSSTEFCDTKVTKNTVCDNGFCRCPYPYFDQESDTFECVRVRPDTVPLGAPCANSTYCGDGAQCTTGNEQICKCQLGYGATSDTACDVIHCAKHEYCHRAVSPLTFCRKGPTRSCGCKEGYFESPQTLECSPEAPNIGEECARENDTVYQKTCGKYSWCNEDQKCACDKGYKARKDLPFRCELSGQPN